MVNTHWAVEKSCAPEKLWRLPTACLPGLAAASHALSCAKSPSNDHLHAQLFLVAMVLQEQRFLVRRHTASKSR